MENIKCVSASNAPKCPLNKGVYIFQKLVVKLSNTSTMLIPPVAIMTYIHPLVFKVQFIQVFSRLGFDRPRCTTILM